MSGNRGEHLRRRVIGFVPALVALLLASPAPADITGIVRSSMDGSPIAGAVVHVQAEPEPQVVTDQSGAFSLPVSPAGVVTVTAALPYDRNAVENFLIDGTQALDGSDIIIELDPLPEADNDGYVPIKAAKPGGCGDCHDLQLDQWTQGAHARAATDPWVLDLYSGDGTAGGSAGYVFRDTHDPEDTGLCATCHAPVAEAHAPGSVYLDEVTGTSALEGVNCSACHTIDSVNESVHAIHLLGNATMRFPDAGVGGAPTHEFVWGPLDDVRYAFMKSSWAPFFSESRMCASCHEYVNPETGASGQSTYSEWLASPYAQRGDGFRSCQDCHMPPEASSGTICDPPPPFGGVTVTRPAAQRHRHDFPVADGAGLADAVSLDLEASAVSGAVRVRATVANDALGHAFPTGVSIRNALLVISVEHAGSPLVQIGGPTVPDWADDDVAGKQDGDFAGAPGTGFAKILEGRINGDGESVHPVLFIDAESVRSNTTIPAASSSLTDVQLALHDGAMSGDRLEVSARLLYRRAFRALAVTKGWTETPAGNPVEVEVHRRDREITLDAGALPCALDIDASGVIDVATDVVYVARYLLGLDPVPPSFRDADPTIPSDAFMATRIDMVGSAFDVDGSGGVDVATDVVYIARHLLGLDPVPPSFRDADPTIPSDPSIASAIDALCP